MIHRVFRVCTREVRSRVCPRRGRNSRLTDAQTDEGPCGRYISVTPVQSESPVHSRGREVEKTFLQSRLDRIAAACSLFALRDLGRGGVRTVFIADRAEMHSGALRPRRWRPRRLSGPGIPTPPLRTVGADRSGFVFVVMEAAAFAPGTNGRPRLARSAAGAFEPTLLGLCLGQWPVHGTAMRLGRTSGAIQTKR